MAEIGMTLRGGRAAYFLTESLGEGLTARVFRATVDPNPGLPDGTEEVAVKVLRSGLDDEIVRHFYQEALYLNEVKDALQQSETTAGVRPSLAAQPPHCYETYPPSADTPTDNDRFMVLELMHGQPLETLLAASNPFDEQKALRLGEQLFRLLHILHTRVKRTYTDLKFDNLWWEEDSGTLRVTDWNVLSERGHLSGIPSDLRRGAYALLRVLTGERLAAGLPLRRQPGWQKLNPGIQQILVRILEPSATPYDTADAVAEDIIRLLRWWEQDPRRLLEQARALLEGLRASQERQRSRKSASDSEETKTQTRVANQFAAMLAVLDQQAKLGKLWATELNDTLDALHGEAVGVVRTPENLIKQAQVLLEARSSAAAADVLREGTREFPESIPLYRQLQLAEAVVGGWQPTNDGGLKELQAILDLAARGQLVDYRKAVTRLEQYEPAQKPQSLERSLRALLLDLDAHEKWLYAEELTQSNTSQTEPNLKTAADAAEIAGQRVEQLKGLLPAYATAVENDLSQDVRGAIEHFKQEALRAGRQQQAQIEANKLAGNLRSGAYQQGMALIAQHESTLLLEEVLADAALDFCAGLLPEKEFNLARKGFAAGVSPRNPRCELFRLGWRSADLLRQCRVQDATSMTQVVEGFAQLLCRERDNRPEREQIWVRRLCDNLYKALPEALRSEPLRQALVYDEPKYIFERLQKQIEAAYATDEQRAASHLAERLKLKAEWLDTFCTLQRRVSETPASTAAERTQFQQIAAVLDEDILVGAAAERAGYAPRVVRTLFNQMESRKQDINKAAAKALTGTIGAEQILDRVAVALPGAVISRADAEQQGWTEKAFNDLLRLVKPQRDVFTVAQEDNARRATLADCAGTDTLEEVLARRVPIDEKTFHALMTIVTRSKANFSEPLEDSRLRLALAKATGPQAYETATAENYGLPYEPLRLILGMLRKNAPAVAAASTEIEMSYALAGILDQPYLLEALAKGEKTLLRALRLAYTLLVRDKGLLETDASEARIRQVSVAMYGEPALYDAFAANCHIRSDQVSLIRDQIERNAKVFGQADTFTKTLIALAQSLPPDILEAAVAGWFRLTVEGVRRLKDYLGPLDKQLDTARSDRDFRAVMAQACDTGALLGALVAIIDEKPDALDNFGTSAGYLVERLLNLPAGGGGALRYALLFRPQQAQLTNDLAEPWVAPVIAATGVLDNALVLKKFIQVKYGPQWEKGTFWLTLIGGAAYVRPTYDFSDQSNG